MSSEHVESMHTIKDNNPVTESQRDGLTEKSTPKLQPDQPNQPNQPDQADETVALPNNIAGTYLACHKTSSLPPDTTYDDEVSSTIGCGFYQESDNSRIQITQLAPTIKWGNNFQKSPSQKVRVNIKRAEELNSKTSPFLSSIGLQANPFDVYFIFNVDQGELDSVLTNFKIIFSVTDLNDKVLNYQNTDFMKAGELIENPESVKSIANVMPYKTIPQELIPPNPYAFRSPPGIFHGSSNFDSLSLDSLFFDNLYPGSDVIFVCAATKPPEEYDRAEFEVSVGCAFYDHPTGARVQPKSFAESIFWSVRRSSEQSRFVEVFKPKLREDELFDVYYIFAVTPATLEQELQEFVIGYEIHY